MSDHDDLGRPALLLTICGLVIAAALHLYAYLLSCEQDERFNKPLTPEEVQAARAKRIQP